MIDTTALAGAIQTHINNTVEDSVKNYVENIVRELAMDATWIAKMESQINAEISRKFAQKLNLTDINILISQAIKPIVEQYLSQKTNGISDLANQTELTVMDSTVVVENDLVASTVRIETNAEIKQTLRVKDLAVLGSINTDNKSWQQLSAAIAQQTQDRLTDQWKQQLIDSVTEDIKKNGITFDNVTIGGHALIDSDCLSPGIRRSSLTEIGTLTSLKVAGETDIGNSLSVRPRRVGINTQHPDMALAVWDEEVALVMGKHRDQTAYIGTLRPQTLIIGVNRSPALTVNERGQVAISYLTVGRHRICHEPECPNYSGTKGDIVFNSNPKNDGVWGWQCLGAFKWVPLRTSL